MQNSFAILDVPAGNGTGAASDVSAMGADKTILIDGGFDAILNIEASGDGVNFSSIKTVQTSGLIEVQVAATWMRVRVSAYKNGSPTVAVGAPAFGTRSATLNVTSVNGSGTSSDIGEFGPGGTVFVSGDFSGAAKIELSDDDVSWSPLTTFQGPGIAVRNISAQFIRVTRSGIGFNTTVPVITYVAANAEPAQPVVPPFSGITYRIVYVRTTGNDETGSGTLANPYRTWQRGVEDLHVFAGPGEIQFLDASGLATVGVETLADDYTLPAFKGGASVTDFANPYAHLTPFLSPVNFVAEPMLADAVTARVTIALVDVLAVNQDPTNQLVSIQLTAPAAVAKAWQVDEWKGKLYIDAAGVKCCVHSNTNDELFLCTSDAGVTMPATIVQPSCVLEGQGPLTEVALQISPNDGIQFIGMQVQNSTPGDTGIGGTSVGAFVPEGLPTYTLCVMPLCQTGNCNPTACYFESANFFGQYKAFNSLFLGGSISPFQFINVFDCAYDTMDGPIGSDDVLNFGFYFNCLVRDSQGAGASFGGGSLGYFNVSIDDSVGNAIEAAGPGLLALENVGGANNGGVSGLGLNATRGAQVLVTDDVTVAGAGGAFKSGDLAIVAAWPAAPFNKYDITAVGAGGATGTGTRVYEET